MDKGRRFRYLLIATLLLVLIFGGEVRASEIPSKWICNKTEVLKADIDRNGEKFWATGTVQGAEEPVFLMSIWVNPSTASWTMLATALEDHSVSCIVSFGAGFRFKFQNTPEEPAKKSL